MAGGLIGYSDQDKETGKPVIGFTANGLGILKISNHIPAEPGKEGNVWQILKLRL